MNLGICDRKVVVIFIYNYNPLDLETNYHLPKLNVNVMFQFHIKFTLTIQVSGLRGTGQLIKIRKERMKNSLLYVRAYLALFFIIPTTSIYNNHRLQSRSH